LQNKYQAKGNSGLWYFTDYAYQADFKIFFVDKKYQAELNVYFVKNKYQAKWKSNNKKQLLF
jgi:hypothetical protein